MHTKLVGIINATPDSFSDGGEADTPAKALAACRQLIEDGADVIDIGAESTRPNAAPVSASEEWSRLSGWLAEASAMAKERGVSISLDTRHAETAEKALIAGVDWINDVTGFREEPMLELAAGTDASLVVMHALSVPVDPSETLDEDQDPIIFLQYYFEKKIEGMEKKGIARERLILDPGIGFGKTPMQSIAIITRIRELQWLGLPLLVGHSRKSFLGLFTDAPAAERDDATLAFSAGLCMRGVNYLRVHNVQRHRGLLDTMSAHMPHP